ncbi:MAG: tetratricopeptide repeat protein [Deltaproteobacteria bacterium]|nr:tetratricopeptide repeat protein [Deltaproteobacteria bacterium]
MGAALAGASCAAQLSRELIRNHPRIKITVLEPQVIETSAPFPPPWTRQLGGRGGDFVPFSGQAVGDDLESAKANALRDLLAAVASYVAVEVESEFESTETERQRGGRAESSFEARSLVKTRASADIGGVEASEVYWEKVAVSPLEPDRASYHLQLLARVPKGEIIRARLKKQLARQEKSGRRTVAVLPFRALLGSPEHAPLAAAFAEELSRRIAEVPALSVTDPGVVVALLQLSGPAGEAEAISAIRDSLLPDWIVTGAYQVHDGRLRVSYSVQRGGDAQVTKTESFERPYPQLFALEEQLIGAIRRALTQDARAEVEPASPARPRSLEAFELYAAAQGEYQAGRNERAIVLLGRALERDPLLAPAQLRLGHVLERLGRYGRVPPRTSSPQQSAYFRDPCTPWSEISTEPRAELLRSAGAAGSPPGDAAPGQGVNVEHVFSAARYVTAGNPAPHLEIAAVPDTAAGAYWQALWIATESGDPRAAAEALVALGDLALRVDRPESAESLHEEVLAAAQRRGDLHFQSLALYGLGRAAVHRGRHDQAIEWLQGALERRALLGEKPYLLEIYNELGGARVAQGHLAEAYHFYERARRIAEELGDPYFEAILGNNLGVLLLLNGETQAAERRFARAWDRSKDLSEQEGMISSALNLSLSSVGRGELERARAYLLEAQRLAGRAGLGSRLAQVHDVQGAVELSRGDSLEALRQLLRAFALHERAERVADSLRVRANLAVADFRRLAPAAGEAEVRCLQETWRDLMTHGYGDWSSPVVQRFAVPVWHGDYARYFEPGSGPTAPPIAGGDRGVTYWYAVMNADVASRLEP